MNQAGSETPKLRTETVRFGPRSLRTIRMNADEQECSGKEHETYTGYHVDVPGRITILAGGCLRTYLLGERAVLILCKPSL